mgnify:CR=1 FL=1
MRPIIIIIIMEYLIISLYSYYQHYSTVRITIIDILCWLDRCNNQSKLNVSTPNALALYAVIMLAIQYQKANLNKRN